MQFSNPIKTHGWKRSAGAAALLVFALGMCVWGFNHIRIPEMQSANTPAAVSMASRLEGIDFSVMSGSMTKQLEFNEAANKKFASQAKINTDQFKTNEMLQQQLDTIAKAKEADVKIVAKLQRQIDDLNALQLSGAAKVSEVQKKQESLAAQLSQLGLKVIGINSAYAQTAPPAADYTLYDRYVASCKGVKPIDPSNKEADAKSLKTIADDKFAEMLKTCNDVRATAAAVAPPPPADNSKTLPPPPVLNVQVPAVLPPAPGAMSVQRVRTWAEVAPAKPVCAIRGDVWVPELRECLPRRGM